MKQSILNLLFSFLSFAIGYGIALLTGLELIQEAILIAYLIQWIAFIPAYIFQTEKFYDLTGSITYLTVVSYVSYHSYASMNVNITSIILAACILLWTIRLGTFLFTRIHRAGEDKRFKHIKPLFKKEIIGLFTNMYPENQDYLKTRNQYRIYLAIYLIIFILYQFIKK